METTFHMSLPCLSVKETKSFYTEIVGASIGRSSQTWIDVNLFGHQLTFIKAQKFNFNSPNYVFEGKILPSFHFGVIVDNKTWDTTYNALKQKNLQLVDQSLFLLDKAGEHQSYFIKDPNDYMLEFKCFKDQKNIFKA